jgi:nucleotide-binding universal stress UspA family protein
VQADVVTSALHQAIRDLAADRRSDLIVMATHARTWLARALVGSVASQLLHENVRPLLCVPPTARPLQASYSRLLVPTDLSVASRRALPWAAFLARGFGSEVLAAYVAPPPTVAVLSGLAAPAPVPSDADLRAFLAPELQEVPLHVDVVGPSPAWSAILALVEQRRADLVVMSSCGHDSLGDHVLGSTTDRVVRHSPVPVLVA